MRVSYICLCMVIPLCLLLLCSKLFFLFAHCLTFYCLALGFFNCLSCHLTVCNNFCYLCCFPAAAISFLASIFAVAEAVKILHSGQGTIAKSFSQKMSYYAGRRAEHLEKHEAPRYAEELSSVAKSPTDTIGCQLLYHCFRLAYQRCSSRRISRELEHRRW